MTTFRMLVLMLGTAASLAGCAANDPMPPTDDEVCRTSFGLPYGTQPYASCFADRQARRRALAAELLGNPNAPVPLPPLPPPIFPDAGPVVPTVVVPARRHVTRCRTVGGITTCRTR